MAKAIMIQGTASGAGKSLLAAGLCRVFRQDGYRVAPFKAQNMALNSFVTKEGLEMGRAQVVQAQAAGIEPSVCMNPVLLKPQSDTGSQVIVEGEVWDTLPAWEYFRRKRELRPRILQAFQTLSAQVDIVIIEGAGSPAEINLKTSLEDDIVNMGIAAAARAPVLLIGDIDRGGVFASLYGTMQLLAPHERSMVKGTIINKFRGDETILRPGLSRLEELTGVPVLGVVPMMEVQLDEEDSQAPCLSAHIDAGVLDIAVPRLPHLSNFTDFSPLVSVPGISLRYVSSPRDWGNPDLVVLPGSKSTVADLAWLRRQGLAGRILQHAARGGLVLGICGGYQMLGLSVSDPDGIEGGGEAAGLGLLPIRTALLPQKRRAQVSGRFAPVAGPFAPLSGIAFDGYEIHMGVTNGEKPPAVLVGQTAGGCVRENVCGCYIHGLFDRAEVTDALFHILCEKKGIAALPSARDAQDFREEQFNLLAEGLRKSLRLADIYSILNRGIEQ